MTEMTCTPRRPDYDAARYQNLTYEGDHKLAYLQTRSGAVDAMIDGLQQQRGRLRILEIACGPGLSQVHLARTHPQHLIVAIDQSAAMLQQSAANIRAAGATPRLARTTALRLPFATGTFDMVFATRFIHIYPNPTTVLDEFRRVLRPGGTLAIEFYGRPYHLIAFLARRLKCPWRQFLWQYPTIRRAQSVMGEPVQRVAVRLGGERWLRRILGDRGVAFCLRHARNTPIQLLVAEYFAICSKEAEPAPRAPAAR